MKSWWGWIFVWVVLNSAAPLSGQEILQPDQVIGRSAEPTSDDLYFHGVVGLLVLPGGELLIAERGLSSLRVVDPRTLDFETIGQRGRGPGEFQVPLLAGLAAGSVWVWDPLMSRATRLSPTDLAMQETVRLPFVSGSVAVLDGGGFAATRGRLPAQAQWLLILDEDGETVRDSLYLGESRQLLNIEVGGLSTHGAAQPWADDPIWVPSPAGDGFAVIERPTSGPRELRVHRYDRNARRIWSDTIEYEGYELTPSYVRRFVQELTDAYSEALARQGINVNRRELEGELADALYIPQRLPAVYSAVLGVNGELYLKTHPRQPEAAATEYWVLSPDGSLTTLSFPLRFTVLYAGAEGVWGVGKAPNDTEYLARYRRSTLDPDPPRSAH